MFLGSANELEAKKMFCIRAAQNFGNKPVLENEARQSLESSQHCFLAAQRRKHLPRKQIVSENIQKHFCFRSKCCVCAQTRKHFKKQCFLVCGDLYAKCWMGMYDVDDQIRKPRVEKSGLWWNLCFRNDAGCLKNVWSFIRGFPCYCLLTNQSQINCETQPKTVFLEP